MGTLFDVVKEHLALPAANYVVAGNKGYVYRVRRLLTDGKVLYADVKTLRWVGNESTIETIDVTDSWVYDVTDGKLLYGETPNARGLD
jgi:predicted ATPase